MTTKQFWNIGIILLAAFIISGGTLLWLRYEESRPIEISLPPPEEFEGQIFISGAIANPGVYPVRSDSSLKDILEMAGGTASDADLNYLKLYVPHSGEEFGPQKIDINRAELWLLEALPGIGEIRARAIVEYREQNGFFHSTTELLKVEGIGLQTYEQIKDLITVSE